MLLFFPIQIQIWFYYSTSFPHCDSNCLKLSFVFAPSHLLVVTVLLPRFVPNCCLMFPCLVASRQLRAATDVLSCVYPNCWYFPFLVCPCHWLFVIVVLYHVCLNCCWPVPLLFFPIRLHAVTVVIHHVVQNCCLMVHLLVSQSHLHGVMVVLFHVHPNCWCAPFLVDQRHLHIVILALSHVVPNCCLKVHHHLKYVRILALNILFRLKNHVCVILEPLGKLCQSFFHCYPTWYIIFPFQNWPTIWHIWSYRKKMDRGKRQRKHVLSHKIW